MIVLAIAPGIRTLAYATIEVAHQELRGEIVDFDILHHTARGFSFKTLDDQIRRAQVHLLVISTCLDRDDPMVVAIGPPAVSKEDPGCVEACRRALRTGLLAASVPFLEYDTELQVQEALAIPARRLIECTKSIVSSPPKLRRPVIIAAAAGMAAARQMLELPQVWVSRETPKLLK